MLAKLFQRLTGSGAADGHAAFDAIVGIARRPDWYVAGGVPDTVDGRFAVLATVAALVMVRLDALGEEGKPLSSALTGRFAEVMDSEHRELGVGDAALGKTVLKLVGSLARRVDLWGQAVAGEEAWREATARSLPTEADIDHNADALSKVWQALAEADIARITAGDFA